MSKRNHVEEARGSTYNTGTTANLERLFVGYRCVIERGMERSLQKMVR